MRSLSSREKVLAGVGGGMLALTLLFFLLPALTRGVGKVRSPGRSAQSDLEELEKLKAQFERLRRSAQAQGMPTGAPPSFVAALEGLADRSDIAKDQRLSMIPSSSPAEAEIPLEYMEIKLERLTLKQLSQFLVNVENFKERSIRTDRLQIRKRADKPELLDAVVRVFSVSSPGG